MLDRDRSELPFNFLPLEAIAACCEREREREKNRKLFPDAEPPPFRQSAVRGDGVQHIAGSGPECFSKIPVSGREYIPEQELICVVIGYVAIIHAV